MDTLTTEQIKAIEQPTEAETEAWLQFLKLKYLSPDIDGINQHESLVAFAQARTMPVTGPILFPFIYERFEAAYREMAAMMKEYAAKHGLLMA